MTLYSVYVAWSEDMGASKIGVAIKPHRRMAKLKGQGHGRPLLFWQSVPHQRARSIERAAHVRFAKSRLNGEWFAIQPETAIRGIRKLMKDFS